MATFKEGTNLMLWVRLIMRSHSGSLALTQKEGTGRRRTRRFIWVILWIKHAPPSSSRPSRCATSPRCTAPQPDSTSQVPQVIRSRISQWVGATKHQWKQIKQLVLRLKRRRLPQPYNSRSKRLTNNRWKRFKINLACSRRSMTPRKKHLKVAKRMQNTRIQITGLKSWIGSRWTYKIRHFNRWRPCHRRTTKWRAFTKASISRSRRALWRLMLKGDQTSTSKTITTIIRSEKKPTRIFIIIRSERCPRSPSRTRGNMIMLLPKEWSSKKLKRGMLSLLNKSKSAPKSSCGLLIRMNNSQKIKTKRKRSQTKRNLRSSFLIPTTILRYSKIISTSIDNLIPTIVCLTLTKKVVKLRILTEN